MNFRSICTAALILFVISNAAIAQPRRKAVDVEPPPVEKILATTAQENAVLAELVAIKPEVPLGPLDVLREYERGMTFIAQSLSAEIANISQAQEANQITREQAEYQIQERYQTAMMQHQVLGALHDVLEHDVAQAASKSSSGRKSSDTAAGVELPSPEPSGACK